MGNEERSKNKGYLPPSFNAVNFDRQLAPKYSTLSMQKAPCSEIVLPCTKLHDVTTKKASKVTRKENDKAKTLTAKKCVCVNSQV